MIQLAWLWLKHQPRSQLTLWFNQRVQLNGSRIRKVLIVALARKLLIAFWKYVTAGLYWTGPRSWPPEEERQTDTFQSSGADRFRRIQVSGPRFGLA